MLWVIQGTFFFIINRHYSLEQKIQSLHRALPTHTHILPEPQHPSSVWHLWCHRRTNMDTLLATKVHSLHDSSLLMLDILWALASA